MDKLAIYFLSQASQRVLDVAQQPARKRSKGGVILGWTIGRYPSCDIAFSPSRNPAYGMVSKKHARIHAKPSLEQTEGGTALYNWYITDLGDTGGGSTNGTHLSKGNAAAYRLQAGVPYQIEEGDRVQFGCSAASVKLSFDIDDTKGPDSEDSGTAIHKRTKPAAPEPAPSGGRTLADVALVILNGPEGIDKRAWWLLLVALAGLYIIYLENK